MKINIKPEEDFVYFIIYIIITTINVGTKLISACIIAERFTQKQSVPSVTASDNMKENKYELS